MREEEKPHASHHSSPIPHPSSTVAAILLAAGRSRRMGAFKPLLRFGKRTVIETCINNLREAGVETLVVVLGKREAEMRARLAHLPIVFAVNPDPQSEMGASIARGVERLPVETSSLLIALVDHPAVPPEVVRFLIDEWRRTGACFLVPTYQGRGGHPVLVDYRFREELRGLDRERGLRALFDRHREEVLRVEVSSPYVARDIDTWDDYRALHLEVFGVEPPAPS
jgi:molybdenum cofactor cytidylyltransferase